MENFFDSKDVAVIDNGTGYVKIGFAGEDLPRTVMPNLMSTKTIQVEQTAASDQTEERLEKDYGNEAYAKRFDRDLHYPV